MNTVQNLKEQRELNRLLSLAAGKINLIRERKGLSRKELSVMMNVNYNALLRLEGGYKSYIKKNGGHNPSLLIIFKAVYALDISLAELFSDQEIIDSELNPPVLMELKTPTQIKNSLTVFKRAGIRTTDEWLEKLLEQHAKKKRCGYRMFYSSKLPNENGHFFFRKDL